MKNFLNYDTEKFRISQIKWNKNYVAKTESMMSLGNGYLGLRSTDEEIEYFNKENLFVNGIFNKEHKNEVPELANLADLIKNQIIIDDKIFSINDKDEYVKTLNILTGTLSRKIIFKRDNKEFELNFLRFVSQDNKHLYCQKIILKQLDGKPSSVSLFPKINGQTTNKGAQHLKEGVKKRLTLNSIQYQEETTLSNRLVIHNMIVNAWKNNDLIKPGTDDYVVTMDRRQIGFKIKTSISKDQSIKLVKLMSVNTSVDDDESLNSNDFVLERAIKLNNELINSNFNELLDKSISELNKIWEKFYLKIKGNSEDAKYDQLTNLFSILHMNSFVPKDNPNLSIGAKGLSGEGYQGHCFWDTEFFILPNYLFTNPSIARNLLEYRYRGIEGARKKARENKIRNEESNLKGAQYPWESAWPSDGEVCPFWGQVDIASGKQVPIASRREEIHVSADVAYAIDQYYSFTGDEKFMNDMGYEIIFDTAMFWSQRAEKQNSGIYEIKDIMGPNEYKGNVDNNAYTNAFAKYNLDLALKYFDKLNSSEEGKAILKEVLKKIPYSIDFKKINDVSKKLIQQNPNGQNIIPENDKFLDLPLFDISEFKLLGDAGKKLFNTKKGQMCLKSQIVKQADVVLLTYLLPHLFSKQIVKDNFEYYEKITTHDSSLSATTYALQAINLRKMDLAYDLYKYSLNIDMGPNMESCDAGIHSGAIAAIWQNTIFGYGGVRWINGDLHINPILPKQWESLEFKILYKDTWLKITLLTDHFEINAINDNKVKIFINEKEIEINKQIFKMEYKYD
ncbi:MAG: glycoside hydrolase family 65 protein [Mycoplasmatales bacterium]|nr:glycoside hydrolase family 65 protein [Mycoplasmatales bacterium]